MVTSITTAFDNNVTGHGATSKKIVVFSGTTNIPYVIVYDDAGDTLNVYKGNAASPTSFTAQDTGNNPTVTGIINATACIDSSDNIHIFATLFPSGHGVTLEVKHYVFRTVDHATPGDRDTWIGASEEQVTTVTLDASPSGPTINACVDTSDNLHLVYTDYITNMGTQYYTTYYVHHNGTAWQTPVEVEGQANQLSSSGPSLTLTKDAGGTVVPHIAGRVTGSLYVWQGNALNATSFIEYIAGTALYNPSIVTDSTRDITYVLNTSASGVHLYNHDNNTSFSASANWENVFVASGMGASAPWWYHDAYVHTDDVVYALISHNTGSNTGAIWGFTITSTTVVASLGTVVASGGVNTDYQRPTTHWATYTNNETSKIGIVLEDSDGTGELVYDEYTLGGGGPADQTVNTSVVAFTITDTAPNTRTDKLPNVPTKTFTLADVAPSISTDGIVNTVGRTLSITATAPAITVDRLVNVPASTFTLTVATPSVRSDKLPNVPATAFTITANAPAANTGGIVNLTARTLTITATAPIVVSDVVVELGPAFVATGTNFSEGTDVESHIARAGPDRIFYLRSDGETIATLDRSGGVWSQTGNNGNITGSLGPDADIVAISSTRAVIYNDGSSTLELWDFDGTNWSKTGNSSGSLGFTGRVSLAVLDPSVPEVAVANAGFDDLEVWTTNDTNFSQVGVTTSVNFTTYVALGQVNASTISVFKDPRLARYSFNGTSFTQVGSDSDDDLVGTIDRIDSLAGSDYLIFHENDTMRYFSWNGTKYVPETDYISFWGGAANSVDVVHMSDTQVVLMRGTNGDTLEAYNLEGIGPKYTVTATAPVVRADAIVNVGTKTFTLVDTSPLIQTDGIVIVGTKAFTIVDSPPVVSSSGGATDQNVIIPTVYTFNIVVTAPNTNTDKLPNVPHSTFTITAAVPNPRTDKLPNVPHTDFLLVTVAPTVRSDKLPNVPHTTFTLVDTAPSVRSDKLPNVPHTTFTITAAVPNPRSDKLPNVPHTVFTITAAAPTIQTDGYVNVPTTTFTLVDTAPDWFISERSVNLTERTFTLTRYPVNFNISGIGDIVIPHTTFTLVDTAPNPRTDKLPNVPHTAFTITATSPLIQTDGQVNLTERTFTITATPPLAQTDGIVYLPSKNFAINDNAPTIQTDGYVNVGTKTFTINANAPNPNTDAIVTIAASKAFVLNRSTPTFNTGVDGADQNVIVGPRSFTLSLATPQINPVTGYLKEYFLTTSAAHTGNIKGINASCKAGTGGTFSLLVANTTVQSGIPFGTGSGNTDVYGIIERGDPVSITIFSSASIDSSVFRGLRVDLAYVRTG